MQKARLYCLISGLVQGVGYRYFAQYYAKKLNIFGYARNLFDGKVEVVAEGEKVNLLKFLDILKQGPPLSDVKKVDAKWEDYKNEYNDFLVR